MAPGALFWAPSATAHANLRSSDPAAGATLRVAPTAATLTFTEPPEPTLAQVHVLDANGTSVERGPAQRAPGDSFSLRVPLKTLKQGTYTVTWRVVSRADGHATAGAFAFGVGVAPSPPASVTQPKTPGPAPLEIAGRWAFITGIVIALGGSVIGATVFREATPALRNYVITGALLALAGIGVLATAQRAAAGVGFTALLATPIGRALEFRAAAVLATLVAAPSVARAGRIAFGFAAVFATAAVYFEVTAGHAAAASHPLIAVTTQSVHFAAAAVWIGGLGAVVLGSRGAASDDKARAIRRFSTAAGLCLAIVAGTGAYRAVVALGRWSALLSSGYGRIVVIKTALLGVLALLGARNRYTNVPAARHRLDGFRRISRAELSVAFVVVVATAVLTGLSPPPPAAVAAAAAPLVATGADLGHTMRVSLEVAPGYAGPNEFRLNATDYDTGHAVGADRVSLRFQFEDGTIGPSTLALTKVKPGLWRATGTNLSLDGRWTMTVLVQSATTSAEIQLELATRCRTQVLSAGPPTIYTEQLAGSGTAQTYVDPGKPGYNEVHFTFFDEKGSELPVPANPAITAWKPGSQPMALEVRRFSAGHFIASGRLASGRWRFETSVSPRGATEPLRACFEQTI